MSPTPTLDDDLERDIARTLHTKADQLTVDASPFPHAAVGHVESTRVTTSPSPRRRLLAVAAVVILLAGGAAVVRGWSADKTDRETTDAAGAPEAWLDETVAFWPAGQEWEPLTVSLSTVEATDPTTWQLFGDKADTRMTDGVLVGSMHVPEGGSNEIEVEGETPEHLIHGQWAFVGPPRYAGGLPQGTIVANWAEGTTFHTALAIGRTEAELAAVLDALEPTDDAAAGFDPSADGSLEQIATATTTDEVRTYTEFAGPMGDLAVSAGPQAPFGGLLHRLAGTPTNGGTMLVTGATPNGSFEVSYAREDGWFVSASPSGPDGADLPADEMSELIREARPVTRRDLIDWAVGQPVAGTADVGEWTVRLHGTGDHIAGVCLVPRTGDEACAMADDTNDGAWTASFPVGDEWLVVAVTNAPDRPLVRTAPHSRSDLGDVIDGQTGRTGGRLVHVVAVPDDVRSVRAGSWDGVRTPYERPLS
ncbi:MAG: hypothetical protein PV358_16415 [Acidimicrobiales bacterium]|nr:hypothetical protein [Acidimicrobiales bacterium]